MESLLQPYKHKPQQTLSTQTAPWRLDERLARGLKTKKQTLLPEGMRASWLGPVFQADGPDLCDVLRALLDLVDQHWSGPLSLHLSPSFMAKAIRLLMPLTDPVPPLQNETTKEINNERNEMEDSREQWHVRNATQEKREQENKQIGVEERRCWRQSRLDFDVSEAGYLKKQLAKTEKELELLKKRLISSVKENYTLRSDNKKVTACWKTEVQPLDLCAYLQKESEVLQEHDKLLKQLEQTLYLLQSNQRSLVTHNNSLLDAIKRRTSKLSDTV
ncbi:leucine-rich repeat-containing protein 36-like isoform X1 [Pygocentrus nattereri]|uniref:leucine-rich repeat-containing protein 36-like isoform X1 n=1 Tax=Pygocentrus nattereri TaxID=42514 RepID=UPI0018910533|nr:leucine-rich repeat-containing protein 36-like isoform X1 [Pygocentrus nattereri]